MMAQILSPLVANIVLASLLWIFSTWKKDVSLVDLFWPLFFVLSTWIWFEPTTAGTVQWAVLLLVMGLLVGGIVIIMYLPIFQMAGTIQ